MNFKEAFNWINYRKNNMFFFRLFLTESLYPVKTKWIVADFSNGKEIYDEIEEQLNGIPVGILGKF